MLGALDFVLSGKVEHGRMRRGPACRAVVEEAGPQPDEAALEVPMGSQLMAAVEFSF